MPRPNRAYGRPGTTVIPHDFADSHARVMNATHAGVCTITAASKPADLTVNRDLTVDAADPTEIYQGPYRSRTLNAQETAQLIGDQEQITSAHLLSVITTAVIPVRAVVTFTDPADPALAGVRLIVRRASKGSLQWERHLWCVEDLTAPPTA